MNGDWLLLTQATVATVTTNFSLAVVKSLSGTINALTRPLQYLNQIILLTTADMTTYTKQ